LDDAPLVNDQDSIDRRVQDRLKLRIAGLPAISIVTGKRRVISRDKAVVRRFNGHCAGTSGRNDDRSPSDIHRTFAVGPRLVGF
jgi:hypothetical protein